jgi:hypothetical protein
MKIQTLIQADLGIPFYQVKVGEYFQYIIFETNIGPRSKHLFEGSQVLMKVDQVGAIDYPYNKAAEENTMFVGEKALVKVVRTTDKKYKTYVKEVEKLLGEFNEFIDLVGDR